MTDKDDHEPKTIEHDEYDGTPYNWYITDHYDAIALVLVVAAFAYWRPEIKAFVDGLVGNI